MSATLDSLRRMHQHIADYELRREQQRGPRLARDLRPLMGQFAQHLAKWNAAAKAAVSTEQSPLAPIVGKWQQTLGFRPQKAEEPGQSASKKSAAAKKAAPGKPVTEKKPPAKQAAAKPSGAGRPWPLTPVTPPKASAPPDSLDGAGAETQEEDGDAVAGEKTILGKGDWLKSHAKIIREQIPKVKGAAADPEKYLKAKAAFLDRNLPKLQEFIKAPGKQHSPLFAYCILYLSDHDKIDKALALCEKALELRQTSPIKRDYHALNFDVRLMHFEREAPKVAKAGDGPRFEAFTQLRNQLMADEFRGHHAKAKVCKEYAQVCIALEKWEAAKQNLTEVRFLNPNQGVSTLLEQCEKQLNPKQ